jgi:tRNA (guanine37-N1)-methyltransferase
MDERVREKLVDQEVSIGDYVLTGGELPAMVLIDAISRFVPGVLGQDEAAQRDSFSGDLLDFSQYTRPRVYRDMEVPTVLVSGDHGAIEQWRRNRSLELTRAGRPDLLADKELD